MTATATKDAQEQVLGIVRKSQEMTLDAIKQVHRRDHEHGGKKSYPARHAVRRQAAVPPTSCLARPSLPTPATVVSATFDFLERLLAEQRKFVGELITSTAPLRTAAKPGSAAEEPAPAGE